MFTPLISFPSQEMSNRGPSTTKIHIMALDGIVHVNSLFTLALFLGLTTTTDPKIATLIGSSNDTSCEASLSVAENLVSYHVYSFSSFLFSSLVAFALKQTIKTNKAGGDDDDDYDDDAMQGLSMVHVSIMALRLGILVCALGSVFGCCFLTMALVDLVQIKLGILACKSWYTIACVGPLVVLVPSALLIYVFLVVYAFTR